MTENLDKVQALEAEVKALREELQSLKAEKEAHAPVEPTASLKVIDSIENSDVDDDLKVETYCRWAAARAGAIVIAPSLVLLLSWQMKYILSVVSPKYTM